MPSRKIPRTEQPIDESLLSPIEQLRHLVDALCEEPFESEVAEEDVAGVRAKIVQLANQYFDAKRESVRDFLAEAAWEQAKRQLERDAELLERIRRERREKENQDKPPDDPTPSDKT